MPKPTGALRLLAARPAMDVKDVAGRLALVEPSYLSVTALDAATGKQVWSKQLQTEPARGYHVLLANGGQVIAWFGNKAHVLDAKTGARSADYDTVQSGGKCWLDVADGVCAARCDCSFQLASCTTGARLGTSYEHQYVEEIDPDGGMSAGCWGGGGNLYGRIGALAFISEEDPKLTRFVAGVDASTGREVWRRPYFADSGDFGHTPDGRTCWVETLSDGVFGVDCARGTELWHDTTAWTSRHYAVAAGAGIALGQAGSVAMLAPRTGKRAWTRTVPADTLAWPAGVALDDYQTTDGVASLQVLDPKTGATLATLPFAKGATLRFDAAGFYVYSAAGVIAYDARGAETARSTIPANEVHGGTTLLGLRNETEVIVLDRATLAEVGRIPAHADEILVEGALGGGRIAAYTTNDYSVGAVGLYVTSGSGAAASPPRASRPAAPPDRARTPRAP